MYINIYVYVIMTAMYPPGYHDVNDVQLRPHAWVATQPLW